MSHQDGKSQQKITANYESLQEAIAWLLPPAVFANMPVRKGSKWKPRLLAIAALLWAFSDHTTLTGRFIQTSNIIKRMFCGQQETGSSYRGFMKMLSKWQPQILTRVISTLRTRMEQEFPKQFQVAGFTLFAVDGSRVETPRTKSNQRAYSAQRKRKATKKSKPSQSTPKVRHRKKQHRKKQHRKKRRKKVKKQSAASIKKKANTTQMWLTLLWHVGTGLPWSWQSGAADSSERHQLLGMLAEMPENSLITADAGFVGYDFWQAILEANHNFVIRVGANVRLIKRLGYAREQNQRVYLWPDQEARKKRPPLVLRLVVVHDGKQPVYLVTSELSCHRLSDKGLIDIYRRRWGIEVFFRTFKQTFGRHKLRSHSAHNAKLELDWSLVALWCLCLLGQRQLVRAGESPLSLSPATAIKAVQSTMRDYQVRPECLKATLSSLLSRARLDGYRRHSCKTSRDYPRKKRYKQIAPPEIIEAQSEQITAAKEVKSLQPKFQSTA